LDSRFLEGLITLIVIESFLLIATLWWLSGGITLVSIWFKGFAFLVATPDINGLSDEMSDTIGLSDEILDTTGLSDEIQDTTGLSVEIIDTTGLSDEILDTIDLSDELILDTISLSELVTFTRFPMPTVGNIIFSC